MSRPNSTITVKLEPEVDPVGVKKFQAILNKPGVKYKAKDHEVSIWNNGVFRNIMSKQAGLTEKVEISKEDANLVDHIIKEMQDSKSARVFHVSRASKAEAWKVGNQLESLGYIVDYKGSDELIVRPLPKRAVLSAKTIQAINDFKKHDQQLKMREKLELYESMYYVNDKGKAFDDEGNSWDTHASPGHYKNLRAPKPKAPSLHQTRDYMFGRAVEALPDQFTLKNVSEVVNSVLESVGLTYKQKFGILINKAKQAGKKQI